MKTDWEIFEKIISVVQILCGITIISVLFWSINISFNNIFEHSDYTWKDVSIQKLIKKHHFFTLLGLIGVINWFKFKTHGWLLSFLFWFLLGFSTSLIVWKLNQKEPNIIIANEEYWIYYCIILISFFLTILLGLRTFWIKYNPKRKSLIILIIFGLIILTSAIDKIVVI